MKYELDTDNRVLTVITSRETKIYKLIPLETYLEDYKKLGKPDSKTTLKYSRINPKALKALRAWQRAKKSVK
jgi:hypothetical protein